MTWLFQGVGGESEHKTIMFNNQCKQCHTPHYIQEDFEIENDDYDSCLNCKQKAPLHLNLFGEYFQSIRILFKHCGHNRKNTNKEDCRVKSESEQIEQDCRAESESGQNFGPLSTTPPSPRAPPAGLLPPLQLPGPGDCKAGYLLPGKEQKPVNILPSATSWLQLE